MIREPYLNLFDLAICLSDACDLVSPALTNHHKQVAGIAFGIGRELGLNETSLRDLVIAGVLHDIGALSLRERLDIMEFETTNTGTHAEVGYTLLRHFTPAERIAEIIRGHHRFWNGENDYDTRGTPPLLESDIIHLADRIALLITPEKHILGQVDDICGRTVLQRKRMFNPEVYDAFIAASQKEFFWLNAISPSVYRILRLMTGMRTLPINRSHLNEISLIFSRIIDFRSRFTATHSAGVASTAQKIAQLIGFSVQECEDIRIAGLLHDLGKLAVPQEILEKPGKLDTSEFNIIRAHSYHTYRILDTLPNFETFTIWGALHHERLNGKGYPFHHTGDKLALGSRIMCIADIFTAIAENRPYRNGMNPEETLNVLGTMAGHGYIDKDIVDMVKRHFTTVNDFRVREQEESKKFYSHMFNTDIT